MMTQSLADLHRSLVIPMEPAPERAMAAVGHATVTRRDTSAATILPFRSREEDAD